MSRALVFDIGNTRVKWGVLEGESLRRTGVVSHADIKDRGFDALTRKLPRRADRLFASNVKGPNFGRRFARAVGMHCDGDVHYAHSQKSGWGVTSAYKQPRTMGVDRWVALVAARAISTGPTLVVDAGTAITIDALDRDGNHLGGQIIPGLDLMADALSRDTSDIGRARKRTRPPKDNAPLFGDSTDKSVAYGAFGAVAGAIERAEKQLKGRGKRPKIILTGGDASRILSVLVAPPVHRPHLVLEGLAIMNRTDA